MSQAKSAMTMRWMGKRTAATRMSSRLENGAATVDVKATATGLTPIAGAVATTSGISTAERAERDWMTRCAAEETMMTKATNMVGFADPRIAVARTSAAPDDSSAPLIAMV